MWIEVNKKYFRLQEVDFLKGDYSKAKKILNWKPKYNFNLIVKEMMDFDMKNVMSKISFK